MTQERLSVDSPTVEEHQEAYSLLPTPSQPESRSWIVGIGYVVLLTALFQFEEVAQAAPTVRLIEYSLCQRYNQGEPGPIDEHLCKTDEIQSHLAFIRGWQVMFDAIPTILLFMPYARLARQRGNGLVLILANLGIIMQMLWILAICSMPSLMPPELVWVSAIFRAIGGGPSLGYAMLLSIASDMSTNDTRPKAFYALYITQTMTSLVASMVAFLALKAAIWLPYGLCCSSLGLMIPLLVKPGRARPSTKSNKTNPTLETGFLVEARETLLAFRQLLSEWRIFWASIAVLMAQFRSHVQDLLLPYTSKRFGWSIAQTSNLIAISAIIDLIMLTVAVPTIARLLKQRPTSRSYGIDLFMTRLCHAMLFLGAVVLWLAQDVATLIFGLIVFGAGLGCDMSMASAVIGILDGRSIVYMNSLVGAIQETGRLLGGPIIQGVWSYTLRSGQDSLGLPFGIIALFFLIGFIFACCISIPRNI